MKTITRVEVPERYRLVLTFDDGINGTAELSGLVGKGVFACWSDYGVFANVRIGPSGELAWGETLDLCSDALYLKVTGKKPEEVFPALRHEPARA